VSYPFGPISEECCERSRVILVSADVNSIDASLPEGLGFAGFKSFQATLVGFLPGPAAGVHPGNLAGFRIFKGHEAYILDVLFQWIVQIHGDQVVTPVSNRHGLPVILRFGQKVGYQEDDATSFEDLVDFFQGHPDICAPILRFKGQQFTDEA